MNKIIKRIYAPSVTNVRMVNIHYSEYSWVSIVRVGMSIVDLGSENSLLFLIVSSSHQFELIKVGLNWSVSIRGWFFGFSKFLRLGLRLFTYESLTHLDQSNGMLIKLSKVIRGKENIGWLITHPLNILKNLIDIFLVLFGGIGIIISKISITPMVSSQFEIKSNSLTMTNV
jgi:hypothetical protein